MPQAVIFYNSETGTTQKYAQEIEKYLQTKRIEVKSFSIKETAGLPLCLNDVDYLFLGSWTKGLMVIRQHPNQIWKDFVKNMPEVPNAKLALFTTYKLLTGSMFKNMERDLNGRVVKPALKLKSRNGFMSGQDQEAVDKFIQED